MESKPCRRCGANEFRRNRTRRYCVPCASRIARKRYETRAAEIICRHARLRAEQKGVPFSLTPDDIQIPTVCPALGIPLFRSKGRQGPNSPTLDRVDNTKGYTRANVRVISWRANAIKKDATPEELELLLHYVKQEGAQQVA